MKYDQVPIIKNISSQQIRITPNAAAHINEVFLKRLNSLRVQSNQNLIEKNLINELKVAITKGIVLNNYPSEDAHNPNDRQIEIYSYINLKNIDNALNGIIKLRILCRLSLNTKTLSLRTIQKNFLVE